MGIDIDDFKLFHNLLSDDLLESLPPRMGIGIGDFKLFQNLLSDDLLDHDLLNMGRHQRFQTCPEQASPVISLQP